jgi:FAD/FMN-containing dehydrogenase
VRAGAGVTGGEFDGVTQAYGLAVTGPRAPSVGMVGFTLGSGSGWLERRMGLAADNLLSARIVVADGREIRTSPTEHPDLFWALRGGGGNFGVVTELEFRAMPLGPMVTGGMRAYPIERAAEVLRAYREVMAGAPDELCGGAAIITAPPAPWVPDELHGRRTVAIIALWAGDPAGAQAGLAPLDALGTPSVDLVQQMPYTAVQSLLAPKGPAGGRMRSYFRFGLADDLSDDAVELVCELAGELATPQSAIILQPLGGAFARAGEQETALGGRDARWAYQLLTVWPEAREDAPNIAWTRAAAAELSDHARCAPYPNFVCDDDRRRLAVPYARDTLARLREVKRTWDPDNVFRSNHNIVPAL